MSNKKMDNPKQNSMMKKNNFSPKIEVVIKKIKPLPKLTLKKGIK